MEALNTLIGAGDDLKWWQMCNRTIIIFLVTLLLVRISGRRSFGMRTPLDNIIVILLGAVMSRAIVGASPFWHVIAACTVLVVLHRVAGWITLYSKKIRVFTQGKKILLYADNTFLPHNMRRAMVSEEEIMQCVRKDTNQNDLMHISCIYMERNGELSVVKESSS